MLGDTQCARSERIPELGFADNRLDVSGDTNPDDVTKGCLAQVGGLEAAKPISISSFAIVCG